MPPLVNRMRKKPTQRDKLHVRNALLKYALEEEIETSKTPNYPELLEELLPFLEEISDDWLGLEDNIEWKSSLAHARLLDYLETQFVDKGAKLQERIDKSRKDQGSKTLNDESESSKSTPEKSDTSTGKTAKFASAESG